MPLPQDLQQAARYDPTADFADRYPGWQILVEALDGDNREEIDYGEHIVRVTPEFYAEGPYWCMEHAAAHIDLHSDRLPEFFTDEHCEMANTLAQIRLCP
jgi:hypothetical protein